MLWSCLNSNVIFLLIKASWITCPFVENSLIYSVEGKGWLTVQLSKSGFLGRRKAEVGKGIIANRAVPVSVFKLNYNNMLAP